MSFANGFVMFAGDMKMIRRNRSRMLIVRIRGQRVRQKNPKKVQTSRILIKQNLKMTDIKSRRQPSVLCIMTKADL
jgi:hypothetical protein